MTVTQMQAGDTPPPRPASPRTDVTGSSRQGRLGAWKGVDATVGLFAVPGVALYVTFFLAPIGLGLMDAFTNADGVSASKWVGLQNFTELLHDAAFRAALLHTAVFAAVITIGQNVAGLGLALLLNRSRRLTALLRGAFFVPALLSSAVVALVWGFVFSPLTGVVTHVLGWVGVRWSQGADLLGTPTSAMFSISAVVIWQFAGYLMVIYLAGLKNIPEEVYEAVRLDGASVVQTFWHVTLPLLRPATSVALTIAIVGNIRLFDPVWLLTGGGPGTATETASTLIYRTAFQNGRFGYAAAQSIIVVVLIVVVVTAQRLAMGRDPKA